MTNQAPVMPTREEAYNFLLDDVYSSQFFTKLASYGCAPATMAEAQEALRLSQRLRDIEERQQVKEAAAGQGLFSSANHSLDRACQVHGVTDDSSIKQAAYAYFQNPMAYNSVLSLHQDQADALAAQAAA